MPTLSATFNLRDNYTNAINRINGSTNTATNRMLRASGAADRFGAGLRGTGTSANSASSMLSGYISRIAVLATVLKGINITDTYINTQARLKLINDGLQTQAELQDKIFAAADRSRGSYTEMANSIAKLGMLAGDSFGSNDETTKFAELMQKSFKLSGASQQEQTSGTYQLTQAMAAGKLQGDEFRSIMENAPMLAQAIADFTGKSKGELKTMSSEGTITADIIKGALFAASDDIEAKFATLPMTFGDYWNKIKNSGINAFSDMMEKINKLINTNGFETFLNGMIVGIGVLATSLGGVLNVLTWIFDKSSEYWEWVEPVLQSVGGVLLTTILIKMYAIIMKTREMVIEWAIVHWEILVVVAAIALILIGLKLLGVTFKGVFEFIGGALDVLATLFINLAKDVVNSFITISNIIGASINGAVNFVLDGVDAIIGALNKIPGVNLETFGDFDGYTKIERIQKESYIDAYKEGSKGFGKIYDSVSGKLSGLIDKFKSTADPTDGADGTSTNPLTVKGIGSGGSVDVSMADEDLQYLKDIAERDYINKFSSRTLAPNIQVTFGDVRETADADQVAGRIQKILQEQIATASEGVHG